MGKLSKIAIPLAIAAAVTITVPHLQHECGGSCHAPLISIGGLFGCSDAKQSGADAKPVKTDERLPVSKSSVKAEHRVTFVELGSVNCIPCKMMQPIMKAVEEEFRGQVRVVFHDVWTSQGKADAMKYKIRVIPTQVFLDAAGNEYFRHEGFFPKEELVKVLKMKGVQ